MLKRVKISALFSMLAAIVLTIWVSVIVASGAGWNPFSVSWNFSNSGAFGDSFAPISTFMASVAAFGALAAYKIQSEEIRRIRVREAEIDQTAQSDRARSISRQETLDRNAERKAFENTFFQLLMNLRQMVDGLDLVNRTSGERNTGHDVFRIMITELKDRLGHTPKVADVERAWKALANHYRYDINHYFRTLYHIVRYVEKSAIDDKYFFIQILRASLSEGELALLALNCDYGEGREKFKSLVERYALLHNLSDAEIRYWKLRKKFSKGAFNYEPLFDDFEIIQ